ncbi:MAG: molecular chaperone TorD family protein [Pirellulales bacterium]|nr:molecular chaperone TorD family protein [Pirellulales bacterium]
MHLDLESTDDQRTATVGMYRLLAALWCSEVSGALLVELRSGACGVTFAEHQFFAPSEAIDASSLAADYCQLFVGPRDHLPPYQSVWEEGQLAGRAAASMRRYGELLERPLLQREVEVDHLGHQLAMMGKIIAAIATVHSEGESYAAYDGLGRDFFAAHLRWPAPLLARAEQQAQTQFYRALSRCTAGFLETEAAFWS